MLGLSRIRSVGLLAACLVLAGCGRNRSLPAYQDEQGFRITPPPGWSERERPASSSPAVAQGARRKPADLPLPPLAVVGAAQETILVRYDRLTAGHQAWLRVTAADVSASVALPACLRDRLPRSNWQRESDMESLEVAGQEAARIAFVGPWSGQDYRCEIVAVRKGDRVWFITASFPAADTTAREQVRQSVAGVTWR